MILEDGKSILETASPWQIPAGFRIKRHYVPSSVLPMWVYWLVKPVIDAQETLLGFLERPHDP